MSLGAFARDCGRMSVRYCCRGPADYLRVSAAAFAVVAPWTFVMPFKVAKAFSYALGGKTFSVLPFLCRCPFRRVGKKVAAAKAADGDGAGAGAADQGEGPANARPAKGSKGRGKGATAAKAADAKGGAPAAARPPKAKSARPKAPAEGPPNGEAVHVEAVDGGAVGDSVEGMVQAKPKGRGRAKAEAGAVAKGRRKKAAAEDGGQDGAGGGGGDGVDSGGPELQCVTRAAADSGGGGGGGAKWRAVGGKAAAKGRRGAVASAGMPVGESLGAKDDRGDAERAAWEAPNSPLSEDDGEVRAASSEDRGVPSVSPRAGVACLPCCPPATTVQSHAAFACMLSPERVMATVNSRPVNSQTLPAHPAG